ncbi:MAG TPA: GspH/FimT family pseudopilin [Myxococcota bacterium]|nr:hypothetical protein [Myxococcales bacterium]HPG25213.1 GspH/FimT family pseudopilin [Myxococcota bacterium]
MRRSARAPSPDRPGWPQGFTVVEMVVLIALIGILGAVAAPRLVSISELRSAQSRRRVLSDLRFAQRLAIGSGCPVQVGFGANGYTLTQRSACRTGAFARDVLDPLTRQAPYAVAFEDVTTTSSVDPIVFDALGRATDATGQVSSAVIQVGPWPLEVVGETGLARVP